MVMVLGDAFSFCNSATGLNCHKDNIRMDKGRFGHTELLEAAKDVPVDEGAATDTVLVVEVQVESAATVITVRTSKITLISQKT